MAHWYYFFDWCFITNTLSSKALKHYNISETTTNFDFEHEQTSSWLKHIQKIYIYFIQIIHTRMLKTIVFLSFVSTCNVMRLRFTYPLFILRTDHILMYVIGTTKLDLNSKTKYRERYCICIWKQTRILSISALVLVYVVQNLGLYEFIYSKLLYIK